RCYKQLWQRDARRGLREPFLARTCRLTTTSPMPTFPAMEKWNMQRRQALLLSLGGVLSLRSGGRLRADAVLPTTQVTTAAKPKSVQVVTAAGAGDEDGRD